MYGVAAQKAYELLTGPATAGYPVASKWLMAGVIVLMVTLLELNPLDRAERYETENIED